MLGKEARLQTGEEWRCWKRSQGWDQTGGVGSQHEQVGRSDVVGSVMGGEGTRPGSQCFREPEE